MLTKSAAVRVKAGPDGDLPEGQFTALVSVFGNIDAYGDVVLPGAFKDTLADWDAAAGPLPVLWSHQLSNPEAHIGYVVSARETDKGLEVTGQLDLEEPFAAKVYKLLKGARVTQFSFSYDVLDGGPGQKDGQDVYELRKLKLYEVGPTLIGANQETELLDVKSVERLAAHAKAGRVLSAANEAAIDSAVAAISDGVKGLKSVLSQVQSDEGKATSGQQEASAAPQGAASAKPVRPAPLALSELLDIELAPAG